MNRGLLMTALAAGACGVAAAQDSIDECGRLVAGAECVLFETDDGRRFIPSDRGAFEVGDRVRIAGAIDPGCVSTCQEGDGCLSVTRVTHCDGDIAVCGTLVQGVECVLLRDDRGTLFALDDLGGFRVGDRVRVSGTFTSDRASVCQQESGAIVNAALRRASPGDCDDGSPICTLASGALSLSLAALLPLIRRRR